MAARLLSAALILGAIAGCQSAAPPPPVRIVETVRVEVPVPVRLEPPAELSAPFIVDLLPVFVAPADPAATSALTADGERKLRLLLHDLATRIEAWRIWATSH